MKTFATSFADSKDVAAFKRAKARGLSDKEAFKLGDNGIGCFGDNTAQERVPMCALPPPEIRTKWGSVAKGRHKGVLVAIGGRVVRCLLADIMPENPANGAGIDLNPAALKVLGLKPPVKVAAEWVWSDRD